LLLRCVGVDYGIGLQIEFGDVRVSPAFAFLDDVVEILAYYEFDFF